MSMVKSLIQKVNGLGFYCEIRGNGPTIALVPSGEGDCGSFAKVADILADEFTVFTLDMRYMSRSERPEHLKPISERDIASDVVELLKVLKLAPASIYGCSSGGQCALSMGVNYPEVCRNIMIHEAALPSPTHPEAEKFFKAGVKAATEKFGSRIAALNAIFSGMVGDTTAWTSLGTEYHSRISKNLEIWADYMVGYADQRTYSTLELSAIPSLVFSVGQLWKNWVVEANIEAARKANKEVVFLPCMHFPQVTIPDLLVKHIRENIKKYIR
jgi:pimeloyl-ACP methyl ester carboxylesterase